MTQDLKHVEKNAHKKNADGPLQPIPKKEVAPIAKKQVEEVKRDPKQEFKMNSYYLVTLI